MPATDPARRSLLVLIAAAAVLVWLVFRPLAEALFLGAVFGAALAPAHRRLTALFRGRREAAAVVLVIGVVVIVLGPLVSLSAFVINEAIDAATWVSDTVRSEGVGGLISELPEPIANAVRSVLQRVPSTAEVVKQVQGSLTSGGGAAAAAVGSALVTTGSLLFQATMMLIALYFFVTERQRVFEFVDDASPLGRRRTKELIDEFRKVTIAVVRSTLLTAGVQSVAALIGYFIARAPSPVFFAAVTFIVALVPALGAASVVLFVALLLFFTGHSGSALFLAIWGVVVVGLSDNLVKPLLIKGDVQMHGAVVFFSLLGGLAAFGPIGLLLGPLAVALLLAVLRIWRRDFGPGETA